MGDKLLCTDLYKYYHKQQRPASTCRKQTISVSPISRIHKAIKCQAVTKIIATASPWLLLDWCSNISYLNKLLIIASHATELQYLKIAYQSEFEFPTTTFLIPNFSNPLTKILGKFCMQHCKQCGLDQHNHAILCIHGNFKYIYMYMYWKSIVFKVCLCPGLHLNCLFY